MNCWEWWVFFLHVILLSHFLCFLNDVMKKGHLIVSFAYNVMQSQLCWCIPNAAHLTLLHVHILFITFDLLFICLCVYTCFSPNALVGYSMLFAVFSKQWKAILRRPSLYSELCPWNFERCLHRTCLKWIMNAGNFAYGSIPSQTFHLSHRCWTCRW